MTVDSYSEKKCRLFYSRCFFYFFRECWCTFPMKADTRLSPGQMILKMMHKSRFLSVSGKADWLLYLMFTSKLEICHSNLKNNFDINDDSPLTYLHEREVSRVEKDKHALSAFQIFKPSRSTTSVLCRKCEKGCSTLYMLIQKLATNWIKWQKN